ncbi:peroxiredoxin family protein [Saliterribacillus persicus]|uniref:Peroxiredoxin n=1 Tax=Saliterribacillus persicus TaxID=930114 RepID=A0A368XKI3_9BACI|nr:redoxin domain-containing protein [Saliterribacillus persicus]RCW67007.1 peroxiredoxin [Saliterribacillus persicus]
MKKGIVIILLLGMVGYAVYDYIDTQNEAKKIEGTKIVAEGSLNDGDVVNSEKTGLQRGELAPDFTLETLDGEQVNLSDYRGTRVFLNFWATWCPPCRAEMPDMQKLYDNEDIQILAVNLTQSEKNVEGVSEFVEELSLTFPIPMDVESEVSTLYRVQAYPTSYLIDQEGRIQYIGMGAMNYDQMIQEFEKMN